MATLSIIANGTVLDPQPELPIDREDILVAEDRRHRSGQLRRAYLATKKRLRYRQQQLTEAQRAAWLAAHPLATSYPHVDELGVSRTVVTIARRDPVSRSDPDAVGTPAYYDLEIEIEEV